MNPIRLDAMRSALILKADRLYADALRSHVLTLCAWRGSWALAGLLMVMPRCGADPLPDWLKATAVTVDPNLSTIEQDSTQITIRSFRPSAAAVEPRPANGRNDTWLRHLNDVAQFGDLMVGERTSAPKHASPDLSTSVIDKEHATSTAWQLLTKLHDRTLILPGVKLRVYPVSAARTDAVAVPKSAASDELLHSASVSPQLRGVLADYVEKYTTLESRSRGRPDATAVAVAQSKYFAELGNRLIGARANSLEVRALAEAGAHLQSESSTLNKRYPGLVPKALYGFDDVFAEASYRHLVDNMARVGGFFSSAAATSTVKGVGIFVGPKLVLTAQHCLASLQPGSSVIWRYATGTSQPIVYNYVQPVLLGGSFSASDPSYGDLALVLVEPTAQSPAPLPPLALASDSGALWDAVYVVAFDKHNNQVPGVYDDAHVLFPGTASPSNLGMVLENALGRRFQQVSVENAVNDFMSQGYHDELNQLLQAYGYPSTPPPPTAVFVFRNLSDGFQPHPRFGFDSPTVRGNSGGGVFSKETGQLLGVFGSGAADESTDNPIRSAADWDRHEEAVAAGVVRAFLMYYRSNHSTAADPVVDIAL